ncbi:MAG: hypothetical protein HDS92_00105 [Bacteroidales bacterium]|nr:hypothetical protein [Bacteroidales bacterium]
MKNKDLYIRLISYILGLFFIIAGFLKALNIAYFQSVIQGYHIPLEKVITVGIVLSELLLGTFLIFRIMIRYTSLVGILMIIIFTAVHSYGYFVLNIRDCGCFGKFTMLNTSYSIFVIRNGILLIGLFLIVLYDKSHIKMLSIPTFLTSIIIVAIGALMCCNFFNHNVGYKKSNFEKVAVKDHDLGLVIDTSPDSTYLIAVFSYNCPHCINSFENLKHYAIINYVDKVIGLCSYEDVDYKENFWDFFKPNFPIIELSEEQLYDITDEYPISFFIKNDTIVKIIPGEIPSCYFLKNTKL